MEDGGEPAPPPPLSPRKLQTFRSGGIRRQGTGGLHAWSDDAHSDSEDEHPAAGQPEAAGAAPLLLQLRHAVGLLMKVHPLCAKVAHDGEASAAPGGDDSGECSSLGTLAHAVPRSLERLRVVRRTLDEALEVAEAVGEDALVETTLRQHELALYTREQADLRSEQERRHVDGVRCDVIELERSMLRSQRTHRRLDVEGAAERLGEFERHRAEAEGVHGYLTNDLRSITESLRTQLQKNGQLDVSMREIEQARLKAMEENAKANQLLASGETLDVYRKAKEREKVAADAEFAQARASCEAEMARLREGWASTEAKYTAEMLELQGEVRATQARLNEKSQEAEKMLAKQTSEWNKCAESMGKQIAYGVQALEDLRKEKAQHLHREVLRSRQREREAAANTQQRLEAQLNEVKLQYRSKLKMEEVRLGDAVKSDRMAHEAARKKAEVWTGRASSMREAYKAHAYKSGAYINTMDAAHKKELRNLWTS